MSRTTAEWEQLLSLAPGRTFDEEFLTEIVRLRLELEGLLEIIEHETWLHDDEGQFSETVQLGSYTADQLKRILK